MKAFCERWAARLASWKKDRNGVDQLSLGLLLISLFFQMLASATGVWLFLLISVGFYTWTLFRVFGKRSYKRFEKKQEVRRFLVGFSNQSAAVPPENEAPQAVQILPLPEVPCADARGQGRRRKGNALSQVPYRI